ncbi:MULTISPECIES: helix-turn-helix domain-containing protein [Bacillus cereus group]|uniref:helix-turn-helix domain-containing protein n=1 Tax=Bacillus cereus group TaxID=86661 RepID=UPI0009456931|nr:MULTISPECIES: helix-turn-helix transcriptional regulator [Bacillus cereus group]MCU5210136.1 helix-turn-helix transcriptional regulator [Bacillus paranthracis]MDA1929515.1 helix-turn-helix transcriptional regulator [Bacillus cereus group sp. BcHK130]ONG93618.1 XRE family transcriptional regulator [Bacillus cereus]
MSIEWKLRQVMAKNDIWSGSELLRRMEDKAGYSMSAASISALMNESPKMIRTETLDALCTALECLPNDLIVHKPSRLGKVKHTEKISKESKAKKASNGRSLPPV